MLLTAKRLMKLIALMRPLLTEMSVWSLKPGRMKSPQRNLPGCAGSGSPKYRWVFNLSMIEFWNSINADIQSPMHYEPPHCYALPVSRSYYIGCQTCWVPPCNQMRSILLVSGRMDLPRMKLRFIPASYWKVLSYIPTGRMANINPIRRKN